MSSVVRISRVASWTGAWLRASRTIAAISPCFGGPPKYTAEYTAPVIDVTLAMTPTIAWIDESENLPTTTPR